MAEVPDPSPVLWDASKVPGEDHEKFKLHTGSHAKRNNQKASIFQAGEENYGSWNSPPNPQCYASFGDAGTTATVSAYGHLMQFSDHLGIGKSGLFSVDHESTNQPYSVTSRSERLISMSSSPDFGDYGLKFPSLQLSGPPRLTWVHWRWPRFEYDLEYMKMDNTEDATTEDATSEDMKLAKEIRRLKLTIQWVVNNKTVLQQCRVENLGDDDIDVPFSFESNMFIRDLDYLINRYYFNRNEAEMTYLSEDPGAKEITTAAKPFSIPGPNGYGWICARRLPDGYIQGPVHYASQVRIQRSEANIVIKTLAENASKDTQLRHAMSRMTNGQATVADRGLFRKAIGKIPEETVNPKLAYSSDQEAGKGSLSDMQPNVPGAVATVVSVFLDGIMLQHSEMETWARSLPGIKSRNNDESSSMEVVTAYRLLHIPESRADWRNFLIPISEANVDDILKEMPFCHLSLSKLPLPSHEENKPPENRPVSANENIAATPSLAAAKEPKDESDAAFFTFKAPFETPSKSSANLTSHIDFIAWRNLENILSNCSIPITRPALREDPDLHAKTPEAPVALTCGDISAHRICTSASFFAFQFLLNIARRLQSLNSSPGQPHHAYVQSLQERIYKTCKGHLIWLARVAEKGNRGCFDANYKVTGKIMHESSVSWRPNNGPTDTPYQLIKAMDFLKVYPGETALVAEVLDPVWPKWVATLHRLDVRAKTVWPHATEEETNIFRLDDHVWIWRALSSLEALKGAKMWKEFTNDPSTGNEIQGPELAKRFSSAEVQREVLRRFTIENEVSRKRMLAVTRSPRDTRFLLHARDTVLFYSLDWKFSLMDTLFHELWDNTIKAQAHHEYNNESSWDNALRYALAVIMGTRGYSINKRAPEELARLAVEVLFGSTSPNGFFPGQLDKETKEPSNFHVEADRDSYFHASFEIPYILLTHADRANELHKTANEALQPVPSQDPKHHFASPKNDLERKVEELRLRIDQLTRESSLANMSEIAARLTAQPKYHQVASDAMGTDHEHASLHELSLILDKFEASRGSGKQRVLTMKKIVPFNSLIDSTNIVNVEEEWLYNYPAFLYHDQEIRIVEAIKAFAAFQVMDGSNHVGDVVGDELKRYSGNPLLDFSYDEERNRNTETFLIDTQKSKQFGKQQKREHSDNDFPRILNNQRLWGRLLRPRSAKGAKKRFIWLPSANSETAFLCFLASPDSEKPYISSFFDRHAKYEKYFFDDTTMVLNEWNTEFHLSFYTIIPAVTKEAVPYQAIPVPVMDSFPRLDKRIARASMGFRFCGDFFDRYWTCHFIQYDPSITSKPRWDDTRFPWSSDNRSWRQRKVLELHLFEIILIRVYKSTQEIFEQVRIELGVREGAFFSIGFILNSEDYFSSSKEWQQSRQILQAIDEELSEVLVNVSKWIARETSRGQERPRWTRRDERKYRGNIDKLLSSTERQITDLRSLQANIRALKETLDSSQDKIRDDLNLRGSENIRFFTYVTVVFLPLGFAASIFSMGEIPEQTLLVSMIICAIVTLTLTVIALVNAKTLASIFETASLVVDEYSRAAMRVSSMMHNYDEKRKEKRMREHQDDVKSLARKPGHSEQVRRRKTAAESEVSWHVPFWLTFFLMELPARFVLQAYHALRDGRYTLKTAADVFIGFFSLPFFILSWLLQLVIYNMVDLIRVLGTSLAWLFSPPSAKMDGQDEQRLNWLTYPPAVSRPIKMLWTKWEAVTADEPVAAITELEKKTTFGSQEV